MKTELFTAIAAAIFGVLIAFFVCNLFIGEIKPVEVKTVSADVNADVDEPDPEIFNYKALNPTVEVYVGSCVEYDSETGECVEQVTEEEYENLIDSDEMQKDTESDQTPNNEQGNQ